MRLIRRRHRVADLEWFEALYRVYLAAFLVGGTILFLSGLVGDDPLTQRSLADVVTHGPGLIGVLMGASVYLGVRSGANGGPLSVEEPEVRHVLLAPVSRAHVLRRPLVQRIRSVAFSGALAGAVAGQLLQRRIPGDISPLAVWALWGAVSGACIAMAFVVAAALTHQLSPARWVSASCGSVMLLWQIAGAIPSSAVPGPFDVVGSLALWPIRVRWIDLCGPAVILCGGTLATILVDRFSLEPLARRSSLVSQLRFAVTLQDIRTVVLLRRQLGGEYSRTRPWYRVPALLRGNPIVARSLAGIARFPARRYVRMILLTTTATASAIYAWRGTTPTIVIAGLCTFVVGLDAVEPLSQEIDQPDRTDSLPRERGHLHSRLLVGSVLALAPLVPVSIGVAILFEPAVSTAVVCAIVAPVALLAGLGGAAINSVMGAPDPVSNATGGLALPPEVSGIGTVLRAAWPPAVACIGLAPVVSARWALRRDFNVVGSVIRSSLGACVLLSLVAGWIHQRDAIKAWFRNAQTSSRQTPIAPSVGSNG